MTVAPFAERLAKARQVLDLLEEYGHELRAEVDTGRRDQMDAAQSEAFRLWGDIRATLQHAEPGRWTRSDEMGRPHVVAHFFAAEMACQRCVHLRRGAAPNAAIVDLNHRLAVCRLCARTIRTPLDDRRCEICDETVADNLFMEFSVRVGPSIFVGNLGTACCGWLLDGRIAA